MPALEVQFATGNLGKLNSAREGLADFGIAVVQADLALTEIQADTFEAVARAKAGEAYAKLERPVLVLDAGLCLAAYGSFPGVMTKYALDTIGTEGLRTLLSVKRDRSASFINCLVYFDGTDKPIIVYSETHGTIAEEERGNLDVKAWSPAYRIFQPTECNGKTIAELTEEEYNAWLRRRTPKSSLWRRMGQALLENDRLARALQSR